MKDLAPLPTVLLVEDDPDDTILVGWAFRRAKLLCQLQSVSTIEQARDYLAGHGMYAGRQEFPTPFLIITDLGFGGSAHSGLEFLQWLRGSQFKSIPVVCVTGSENPSNAGEALDLAVACIRKSALFEQLLQIVRQILANIV